MAYNNNYYNGNNKTSKEYSPNLNSAYRFSNVDSTVDPSCLTFAMWKGSLKVSINPRKDTNETTDDGRPIITFDYTNGITIYLNHTKARILACELRNFLKDPATYNGCGVASGQNLISISDGSEYGSDSPILTIRKVDESGRPINTFAYQFHKNYHGAIRNFINDGEDCYKVTDEYDNIEILEFITMLEEYYKAVTNAVAFTVFNSTGKDVVDNRNKLNSICDKLGITVSTNTPSYASNNTNNYFNRMPSNSGGGLAPSTTPIPYHQASLDDLMDE